MKTFKKFAAAAFICGGLVTGLASFTSVSSSTTSVESKKGNIEFRLINDTGADFKYCANGGHNTISKGTTKVMSFQDGTEIKYVDGSSCGKTWFKVSSSLSGKTYKISELK